jgi:hypothetical protein
MSSPDQRFGDDVNQIVKAKPTPKSLSQVVYPAPIGQAMGAGQDPVAATTAGIASPLTETKYADRLFYNSFNVASSDGLFVFSVSRLKQLKMLDAKGKTVVLKFQDKT